VLAALLVLRMVGLAVFKLKVAFEFIIFPFNDIAEMPFSIGFYLLFNNIQ
tara:strand:- start:4584 stop:4733 length:150 start_codon:yes stop_codon:yes gene_type:complete